MKDAFGVTRWEISKGVADGLRLIQGMEKTTAGLKAPGSVLRRAKRVPADRPGFAAAKQKMAGVQRKAADNQKVLGVMRRSDAKRKAEAEAMNTKLKAGGLSMFRYDPVGTTASQARRKINTSGAFGI